MLVRFNVRYGSKAEVKTPPLRCLLTPEADMCSALAHVCFGPKADLSSLLDDLVGAADQ